MTATTSRITVAVNGERMSVEHPDPAMRLVDFLRAGGLTGTKIGCGEGGCGACTVMLTDHDSAGDVRHRPINSCLRPLCSVDGMAVTTIEGIGNTRDGLHPVQHAVAIENGTQCGFCTPGFVMNMFTLLLQDEPHPDPVTVERRFDGNLCRCTGFRPILDAMQSFSTAGRPAHAGPPLRPLPADIGVRTDPVPPPTPPGRADPDAMLHAESGGVTWIRPVTLADAHRLKEEHGGAANVKLVGANTSSGIYTDAVDNPPVRIEVAHLAELRGIACSDDGVRIGAAATYDELIAFVRDVLPGHGSAGLGLLAALPLIEGTASTPIRSVATAVGNVMLVLEHAERGMPFTSDLFTILLALDATLEVASLHWVSPRRFALGSVPAVATWPIDAVVTAIVVPPSQAGDRFALRKVARRPQFAHAIVNTACSIRVDAAGQVEHAAIAIGGIARVAMRAARTEARLTGSPWTAATWDAAREVLRGEAAAALAVFPDEGITDRYRLELVDTLFYKAVVEVSLAIDPDSIPPADRSAGDTAARPVSSGRQRFEPEPGMTSVGQPFTKFTAFAQTSGEARYTDDVPEPHGTLHAAFVTSPHASATFAWRRDPDEIVAARRADTPGFRDLVTVRDIPVQSANTTDRSGFDPLLAVDEVTWFGQPIAMVVADTARAALAIAADVAQRDLEFAVRRPVLTIDEALALPDGAGVFASPQPDGDTLGALLRPGSDSVWLHDPSHAMAGTTVAVGTQVSGAQAQFYMEPQAVLAVPGGGRAITVHAAAQDAVSVQSTVADALGLSANDVDVRVALVGGGFGGKTTRVRFMAVPVAVAAWKLHRPVRLAMTRDVDLTVIGKRHPYRSTYSVAYRPDGTIDGLAIDQVVDGGCSLDCSFHVVNEGVSQSDAAYTIPTLRVTGTVTRTNKATSSAMRGFGVPQSVLVVEDAVEQVAHVLGLSPEAVRERNLYGEHDTTPAGQHLVNCDFRSLWPTLVRDWHIDERRGAVAAFNRDNRWRKRGLAMLPVKYGVSYSDKLLDQGGALLSAFASDGSVLVQTGGVEVGQGLQTKMLQIAAQELGIDIGRLRIDETNVDAVPNAIATGASTGSDLNGGAVADAARRLRRRLEHFCEQQVAADPSPSNPLANWNQDWAQLWPAILSAAWVERVSLSELGYYRTPGLAPDSPFFYFTYSAAATEVEIDVLTGETTVLRADLLYDAGDSINPAIDLGQVQGAYVQGLGMMMCEEVVHDAAGALATNSTWTYKPPCSTSIPIDFRVSLRHRHHHDRDGNVVSPAVYSSKATGEPPLVLAASAFFAIKAAVLAARHDRGNDEWFQLDAPATVQRVQQACLVDLARTQTATV